MEKKKTEKFKHLTSQYKKYLHDVDKILKMFKLIIYIHIC